jgi:hypothetical protein
VRRGQHAKVADALAAHYEQAERFDEAAAAYQ